MKTYYIKIENYTTELAIYKIDANSYEEAVKKAREIYTSQLQFSSTTEQDFVDFAEANYIELS